MEKAQIRIIRSKRKTVALEIRPDLSVLVRAPYWMADWQIRKFVDEKSDWLYAHLREMEQKQKLEAARPKAAPLNPGELQVLADEALRVIPERVQFYAPVVGVTYGRITIRNQRTRWGSCSGLPISDVCTICPLEIRCSSPISVSCASTNALTSRINSTRSNGSLGSSI